MNQNQQQQQDKEQQPHQDNPQQQIPTRYPSSSSSSSSLHKSLMMKRGNLPPTPTTTSRRPMRPPPSQGSSMVSHRSNTHQHHHNHHSLDPRAKRPRISISQGADSSSSSSNNNNTTTAPSHTHYEPLHWSQYFDEEGNVEGKWHYYISRCRRGASSSEESQTTTTTSFNNTPSQTTQKPQLIIPKQGTSSHHLPSTAKITSRQNVLVLIHGGGLTSLSWALFVKAFRSIEKQQQQGSKGTQHSSSSLSAGSGAPSQAKPSLAPLPASFPPNMHFSSLPVEIIALDLRDHGKSFDSDELSMEDFTRDVVHILKSVYRNDWNRKKFVLCGHSLGGVVAVHTAHALKQACAACIVLDVVEGTALQALPHMKQLVSKRPQKFRSIFDAITWAIHNVTQSAESAAISFPSQLKPIAPEEDGGSQKGYTWRTDLLKSAPYWREWYENLSSSFLALHQPKLLILANKDRLDRELTIAEMQGKFQLKVVYASGHYVHEDNPAQCASTVHTFINKFCR